MDNTQIVEAIHRLERQLSDKLAENTAQLATHTQKLDEHCDKIDILFEQQKRIDRTVYGVGGEGDGLATRVKLLEESDKGRKKATYTLFGVSVPTFLVWLWDLIKN